MASTWLGKYFSRSPVPLSGQSVGPTIPRLLITTVASMLLLAAPASSQGGDAPAASKAPAAGPVDWRAASREDILQAYDIFREHHPGMFDPRNPGFPARLRHARDAALAAGEAANDDVGHMRAAAVFNAGLADGHAHLIVSYNGHGDILWPGFRTVWRDHGLYVLDSPEGGPPRGSVLLGCDGRKAQDLIREQVFQLNGGRSEEAGQWWVNAPLFFLRAQPYGSLPRQCSFQSADGHSSVSLLKWRAISKPGLESWFAGMVRPPIGLSRPRPGLVWITLSTFSPDDADRAAYQRLFRELDSTERWIPSTRAIVIDLQKNHGGSSSWSEDVADRLWGKAAVDDALAHYFRHTQIWWLADSANIAYFQESAVHARAEDRVEDADDMSRVAVQLAAAKERGERFYVEDFGALLAAKAGRAKPRALPPVYIVTDGDCVSACLDAVDLFTRFPGVKLVGAPTSADSNYLEVRLEPLPSGRGAVWLPTKIWVNRPRRAGQVYEPEIPVNDLEWTQEKLLDHMERDLSVSSPSMRNSRHSHSASQKRSDDQRPGS